MATQHQRHSHDNDLAAPAAPAAPPLTAQESAALYCPECGMPTWIEWSEGGHVKIRCFSRHWFLMLADSVGIADA